MALQRSFLERQATWRPEEVAIRQVDEDRTLTYRTLDERANAFANALHDRGVRQGDRVLLALYNTIEFPVALYACHKRGFVPVATNYRWAAEDFADAIDRTRPRAVVYDAEIAGPVESAVDADDMAATVAVDADRTDGADRADRPLFSDLVDRGSTDRPPATTGDSVAVSYVFFTSGTSGTPKAVAHSTESARARMITSIMTGRMTADTVCLLLLPLFHGGGIDTTLRSAVGAGAELLLVRDPNVADAVDVIEERSVTDVRSVPTLTRRVLDLPDVADRDFSSIEHWRNTGAVLTESLAEEFVDVVSPNLYNSYGSSECGNTALLGPGDLPEHAGAAGRPVFDTDVRLVEPDADRRVPPDETVPPGDPGEVIIRTDQMFTGYYEAGEVTAERIRFGWYYTRDMGVVDEQGYLTIEGRIDDMVVTGGELVSVVEVEELLESHPDVAEAIVVGEPHEEWGQLVRAHVVGEGDHDRETLESTLREFCEDDDSLANYKRPRKYVFESSLEHTDTGKKRRSAYAPD